MVGIKLPFLMQVWNGECDDGEGNIEPPEVSLRFNLDTPEKVMTFFDSFLKDQLNDTLNKHHFTDLDEYVKNQTGVSLEDLELLSDERIWKQSRYRGWKSCTDFMKKLRVGFEEQLPAKTVAVQSSFASSLKHEMLHNNSGRYPHLETLVEGSSPFGKITYGEGGRFEICEYDILAYL